MSTVYQRQSIYQIYKQKRVSRGCLHERVWSMITTRSFESAAAIHWHLSGLSNDKGERLVQLLTVRWAEYDQTQGRRGRGVVDTQAPLTRRQKMAIQYSIPVPVTCPQHLANLLSSSTILPNGIPFFFFFVRVKSYPTVSVGNSSRLGRGRVPQFSSKGRPDTPHDRPPVTGDDRVQQHPLTVTGGTQAARHRG